MDGWPAGAATALAPEAYLSAIGTIFATFDARTQDSGNVSYGVEAFGRRWFIKTAGDPADGTAFLSHAQRTDLLLNAQRLALAVSDPALPALHGVIASAWGPGLVYDWVPGELLRAPAERRDDPSTAFQRFRALPPADVASALGTILDLHCRVCGQGWTACDFYDGSIIYDFQSRRPYLIDLDSYHPGAFTNEMGRMFGSTRFMAPEEFERGATIDERTTVFTLGRAISVLLGDGTLDRALFRGTAGQYAAMTTACRPDRAARFRSVDELARAWRQG